MGESQDHLTSSSSRPRDMNHPSSSSPNLENSEIHTLQRSVEAEPRNQAIFNKNIHTKRSSTPIENDRGHKRKAQHELGNDYKRLC